MVLKGFHPADENQVVSPWWRASLAHWKVAQQPGSSVPCARGPVQVGEFVFGPEAKRLERASWSRASTLTAKRLAWTKASRLGIGPPDPEDEGWLQGNGAEGIDGEPQGRPSGPGR